MRGSPKTLHPTSVSRCCRLCGAAPWLPLHPTAPIPSPFPAAPCPSQPFLPCFPGISRGCKSPWEEKLSPALGATPGASPARGLSEGKVTAPMASPRAGNAPPGVDPEAFSWFQTVDTDHSGFISVKELKQALVNNNWSSFNDETCLLMISEFGISFPSSWC